MNGTLENATEAALGTWFSLNDELHSTLEREPVFRGLTEDQLIALMSAHEEFKTLVLKIVQNSKNKE